MSQENAKKLIDMVSANEALKAELKEISKIEDKAQAEAAFVEFAKKNACECTVAEFTEAQKATVAELSPEDLAKVDGGWCLFCISSGRG